MKAHLERMLRSMVWADEAVLTALRDCPEAQNEGVRLFSHVLAAEEIWLSRIERRQPGHAVWPQLDLAACEHLAAANAEGYAALMSGLSEADLDGKVVYRNTKGEEFTTLLVDILTHVVIHGAYHRGQIARVFGDAGIAAANTDFISYVRIAEPRERPAR
jgi:uncharacterized damage-inducible protein DinB